jgi:hypothetical protein
VERLKYFLIGLVVVLAAAVVYGYVDDSADREDDSPMPVVVDDAPRASGEIPDASGERSAPGASQSPARRAEAAPTQSRQPRSREGSAGAGKSSRAGTPEAAPARKGSAEQGSAAFVARGNAICQELPRKMREGVERVQRDAAETGTPPDPRQLIRAAGAPVLERAASEFDAAVPPGDARAQAIADAVASAARGFETATSSVSPAGLRALAEFQRRARQYGLHSCRAF